MQLIQFPDRCVSYQTFIKDLASQVALLLKSDNNDPERMSQNAAYRLFGRANVERWRKDGRLTVAKRPGKWNTSQPSSAIASGNNKIISDTLTTGR